MSLYVLYTYVCSESNRVGMNGSYYMNKSLLSANVSCATTGSICSRRGLAHSQEYYYYTSTLVVGSIAIFCPHKLYLSKTNITQEILYAYVKWSGWSHSINYLSARFRAYRTFYNISRIFCPAQQIQMINLQRSTHHNQRHNSQHRNITTRNWKIIIRRQ